MKNLKVILFALLFFTLTISVFAQSQTKKPVEIKAVIQSAVSIEELKLKSKLMAREMPYRVLLPRDYEKNKTEKFAVVYLLHGFGGSYSNWADKTNLKQYAADLRYIIVMPEGGNGFYTDSSKNANDKYESYIIQELIPEVDAKFRTLADRGHRAVAGLSMGGYGAMKFGLKYPQMFVLAGSFSGAITASSYRNVNELPPGSLGTTLLDIFGAPESETHQANDLFRIISQMPPDKAASLPFLYLDCGTEDELGLLAPNRMFVDILQKRRIPHEFRELPGKHDWVLWNTQVQEFLRLSQKFIK